MFGFYELIGIWFWLITWSVIGLYIFFYLRLWNIPWWVKDAVDKIMQS